MPVNEHTPDGHVNHPHSRVPFGRRLTNYFITGFVIAAPLGIAIYVTWWVISVIDDFVKPLIPPAYNPDTYLPIHVPGIGLVFALVAITILGFLTATLIGRSLVQFGEAVVARIPFFSVLYRALKQIVETVVSQSSANFKYVGLIEYPRKDLYALVFVSTTAKGEIAHKVKGEDIVSVFLPTTPNPTSGYLLFLPREEVIILDMSIEDGAKLVISAGLVSPEYQETTRALANQAKAAASESFHAHHPEVDAVPAPDETDKGADEPKKPTPTRKRSARKPRRQAAE